MESPSMRILAAAQSVCRRLAAHETEDTSAVSMIASFDDAELSVFMREAAQLCAETDALLSTAAGVVAKRSERALGYSGLAQREGHRTPVAMVQAITGATRAEAARQVRLGEALGEADAAARLCTDDPQGGPDGQPNADERAVGARPELPWYAPITNAITDHVITAEVGAGVLRGLGQPDSRCSGDALRAAAIDVLGRADGVNVEEATKLARWARDAIDPVGVEERAEARYQARAWRFGRDTTTGAHTAWVVFDDESAAWAHAIIDSALAPRRGGPRFVDSAEQARAQALLDDPRSNDQLVFDTMMDVLHAGATADAAHVFGVRQPGVRIVTTVQHATLRDSEGNMTGTGFYENTGEAVPGSVVDRHLCNTGTVPITVADDGSPLNVGREQRLFTTRQRIALRVRDGGCLFPGCDRAADYGEAHHIEEWVADHGRTDIADGILLCRHHHMLIHNNKWKVTREGSVYHLIPPAAIDPQRQPIPLRSKSPLRYQRSS